MNQIRWNLTRIHCNKIGNVNNKWNNNLLFNKP